MVLGPTEINATSKLKELVTECGYFKFYLTDKILKMDKLFEMHAKETSRRFGELKDDIREMREELKEVNSSLSNLIEFKISMVSSSKWVGLIIGAGSGLVTFIVTTLANYYIARHSQ